MARLANRRPLAYGDSRVLISTPHARMAGMETGGLVRCWKGPYTRKLRCGIYCWICCWIYCWIAWQFRPGFAAGPDAGFLAAWRAFRRLAFRPEG
jgi:hypothetical protein